MDVTQKFFEKCVAHGGVEKRAYQLRAKIDGETIVIKGSSEKVFNPQTYEDIATLLSHSKNVNLGKVTLDVLDDIAELSRKVNGVVAANVYREFKGLGKPIESDDEQLETAAN